MSAEQPLAGRVAIVTGASSGLGARFATVLAQAGARVVEVSMLDAGTAVLGPAEDGGWWALALADPGQARALDGVPMSTEGTCKATEAAFVAAGLEVAHARVLCDVDTVVEAEAVAVDAPWTRFARLWDAEVRPTLVGREAREV